MEIQNAFLNIQVIHKCNCIRYKVRVFKFPVMLHCLVNITCHSVKEVIVLTRCVVYNCYYGYKASEGFKRVT